MRRHFYFHELGWSDPYFETPQLNDAAYLFFNAAFLCSGRRSFQLKGDDFVLSAKVYRNIDFISSHKNPILSFFSLSIF